MTPTDKKQLKEIFDGLIKIVLAVFYCVLILVGLFYIKEAIYNFSLIKWQALSDSETIKTGAFLAIMMVVGSFSLFIGMVLIIERLDRLFKKTIYSKKINDEQKALKFHHSKTAARGIVITIISLLWILYIYKSLEFERLALISLILLILIDILIFLNYKRLLGRYEGIVFSGLLFVAAVLMIPDIFKTFSGEGVFKVHAETRNEWINIKADKRLPITKCKVKDQIWIWSKSDFILRVNPIKTAIHWDSLQGINKFENYLQTVNTPKNTTKKTPKTNNKKDMVNIDNYSVSFVGSRFTASDTMYSWANAYIFEAKKDIQKVEIKSNPDSLLVTYLKFGQSRSYFIIIKLLSLIGLAGVLYMISGDVKKALLGRQDPIEEFKLEDDKVKSKQGAPKRLAEETSVESVEVDDLGNDTYLGKEITPRGTTEMQTDNRRGEVIRKVDQSIIDLTASIMNISEDLIKIQGEQSLRLSGTGGIISVKINGYVDRMLQEIKQRKIKDISMANEVLSELTKYRDLLRSFLTSDLKDRVATLRLQQEVVDLESKLFSARPKGNDVEGNKKVRIKLRYSPLIKRYNSEIEAEQMMLFCETAEEYKNDIEGMLTNAGWNRVEPQKGKEKGSIEREKEEILRWVRVEKMKISSGIDLALHKAEMYRQKRDELEILFPDNPEIVENIMDEVKRILFEEETK